MKTLFYKKDTISGTQIYEQPSEKQDETTKFPSQVRRNIDNLLLVGGLSSQEQRTAERASNLNPNEKLRDKYLDPGEAELITSQKKFTGKEIENTKPLLEKLTDISALEPASEYELEKAPELCQFEQTLPTSLEQLEVRIDRELAERLIEDPKHHPKGKFVVAYGIVQQNLKEQEESSEPLFESEEIRQMEEALKEARNHFNSHLSATFRIPKVGTTYQTLKGEGVGLRLASTTTVEEEVGNLVSTTTVEEEVGKTIKTLETGTQNAPKVARKEVVRKHWVEIQLPLGASAIFIDPYGKGELKVMAPKVQGSENPEDDPKRVLFSLASTQQESSAPRDPRDLLSTQQPARERPKSLSDSDDAESCWMSIPGLKPGHHIIEIRKAGQKEGERYAIYVPPFETRESFDLRDRCTCPIQDAQGTKISRFTGSNAPFNQRFYGPNSFNQTLRMPQGVYRVPGTKFELRIYNRTCASLALGKQERFFIPDSQGKWILADPNPSPAEIANGIGAYGLMNNKETKDPFDFGPGKTIELEIPVQFGFRADSDRESIRILGLAKSETVVGSERDRIG